jgi:hypothetical protein
MIMILSNYNCILLTDRLDLDHLVSVGQSGSVDHSRRRMSTFLFRQSFLSITQFKLTGLFTIAII